MLVDSKHCIDIKVQLASHNLSSHLTYLQFKSKQFNQLSIASQLTIIYYCLIIATPIAIANSSHQILSREPQKYFNLTTNHIIKCLAIVIHQINYCMHYLTNACTTMASGSVVVCWMVLLYINTTKISSQHFSGLQMCFEHRPVCACKART